MEYKVWDGSLDLQYIIELDVESDNWNWNLTNIANRNSYPYGTRGTHKFFGSNLYEKNNTGLVKSTLPQPLYDLYLHILRTKIQPFTHSNFELIGVMGNCQPFGSDGSAHRDMYDVSPQKDYTLMLFLNSEWEEEWGGEFQFLESLDNNSKVLKSISPKPGRFVFFEGMIPHRGLSPKVPNVYRKTLVYRLKRYE